MLADYLKTYFEDKELKNIFKDVIGSDPPQEIQSGNPHLMTQELMQILGEHAMGNYRALCAMANELLMSAAHQEKTQLDQKLYFECLAVPLSGRRQKRASSGSEHGQAGVNKESA